MVGCELAGDVAGAVTARSGALPGDMKALVGWTHWFLQSLLNLGPVQVWGNADGCSLHRCKRLSLNNTCLPLGLTCDFTYRW